MTKSVLVVGSLNHDTVYRVPHLPARHETIAARSSVSAPGGKGSNQAAACATATDMPVRMLGCVGKDGQADLCVGYLRECGVDVSHLVALADVPTGSACVVVEDSGHNQIIVAGGANARMMPEHLDAARPVFHEAAIVVCQLEVPLETIRHALELARAAGGQSILNPAPFVPGADALIALADIITPNETEAASLTGLDVTDEASARRAAQDLIKQGARAVIITLGAQGALAVTQDEARHIKPYPVNMIVDTTGAGDVFNGALAAALAQGSDLFDAADFASAAGALSVTKPTASYCAPSAEQVAMFRADALD